MIGFDRSIPPGGEGKVSIRLYPKFCEKGEKKTAIVTSNDPQYHKFTLVLEARLK